MTILTKQESARFGSKAKYHKFSTPKKRKTKQGKTSIGPSEDTENEIVSSRRKDFAKGLSRGFSGKGKPSLLSRVSKAYKRFTKQ